MKKTKNESAQEKQKTLTRAEKKDAAKSLIKDILQGKEMKSNELIDEAAKVFAQRFQGEENENPNDVKGRIGSVLDVMKKEGEVQFDGGMYSLKTEKLQVPEGKTEEGAQEKPVKKTAKKTVAKKKETDQEKEKKEETVTEKAAPKKRATKKKTEKAEEIPARVTVVIAEEKAEEVKEETPVAEPPAPKKRGRKPKAEQATQIKQAAVKEEETPVSAEENVIKAEEVETPVVPQIVEEKEKEVQTESVEIKEQKAEEVVKTEEKVSSPQGTLMDMSFLFDALKPQAKVQKPDEKPQEKTVIKEEKLPVQAEEKTEIKAEEKPQEKTLENKPQEQKARGQVQVQPQIKAQKQEQKSVQKTEEKPSRSENKKSQEKAKNPRAVKVQTADEKLQEAFLNRLHRLGGEYFEYYSVYLLEKYSRMNGRRLEMLKITAGERDGGIDGEIELTDRLGFRETIYIQAKNWDPSKGDEKLWVVGETLLQQFIGACVCRQAKEGKQHCRGIFITTSRFTPEAKKILNDTSDKFVGYDGADLYETAKECKFGLVQKNGEWTLDEQLLSGVKAFYSMV